ncbi:MAG: MFS transporter, partial [Anaerolineaceae bacterium]|nr:MFS transporter [Anaerolineaceae bacterium]
MSRDLKVVSAAMLTWGLGEGMFYIFQPLYIQQFGADPIMIGTILGISGLVMAIGQVPAGLLADKIGRRPLMWFSWISGVVAAWIMALAPSLTMYVIGMLLYAITSSVMAPLNTYVQGARGNWTVGRAVSFVSASYNIGGIIGPIAGGLIGEHFDLRTVYYVAGVIFTVSSAIILLAGDQKVLAHPKRKGDAHLLQNRQFLGMLVMILFVMTAVTLPQPLAANFLQNQRGISLSSIGQLGSLGALGSVIMMLLLGRMQSGAAILIGQISLMGFSFLLWKGTGLIWYGLGYLFLGGYRLTRVMTIALVRPVVREREVGLAFGMVESLNSLATVIAPVLAGLLYDWRPDSIFPASLIVLGVTFTLSLRYTHRKGYHRLVIAEMEPV